MKHLSRAILAVFMAVLMGTLLPVQVFADTPDYISEVKIFAGDYSSAEAEGYTLLKDGSNPVDLNQDAGGSIGSKGEKAVYLGYKTTKNKNDAITDLALMNMKGGYRTNDYESLMNTQMNAQIIPFVDNFLSAIKEYRANYNSKKALNKKRAQFVHDALNKLTDDDCGGAGLGGVFPRGRREPCGHQVHALRKRHAHHQGRQALHDHFRASGRRRISDGLLVEPEHGGAEDGRRLLL